MYLIHFISVQLRAYLTGEVLKGRGRLAPHRAAADLINDIFVDLDWNQDESLSKDELNFNWIDGGVEVKISDEL